MKEKKMLKAVVMTISLVLILSLSTLVSETSAAKPESPAPVTITGSTTGDFARSVATNGTYVVAGAPYEYSSDYYAAGNTYVYNTSGTLVATLTSQNPTLYGYFGYSVAIGSGLILVGAYGENDGGNVYVFKADGTYVRTLTSNSSQNGGEFGYSVAIGGGYIVVGALGESSSGYTHAGNAYIFATNGTLVAKLTSESPQAEGIFGVSVATDGTTVVVGASQESSGTYSRAGNAYMFKTDGTYIGTLTSPNAVGSGYFGRSVAVDGRQVVVGAPGETYSNSTINLYSAGHAYIFTTNGRLARTLTSGNPTYDGDFGSSLAINGKQLVVGAYLESYGEYYNPGRAYIFQTSGRLVSTLTSPSPHDDEFFGYSVATSGGFVVVGAYAGYGYPGNAYVYQMK